MMLARSRPSKWILILLLVTGLISACGTPTPSEVPPTPTEVPSQPPATESPTPTETPTELPATEPPVTPIATQKSFVEPPPLTVHEYGQGGETRLCDPAQPVLTPVEQLEIQVAPSQLVEGATAQSVIYVNPDNQNFQITVHSVDPAAAEAYLKELTVCLEAIEVGPPSGIEAATPSFEQLLRDAISDATGRSAEELQPMWEEYIAELVAAGQTPTLRGFFESLGVDPDAVLNDAVTRAQQAIDDARNAGLLTAEQAADLSARSQIEYEEDFANSIFSILPVAPSGDFTEELQAHPLALVIEAIWLDTREQENYMIFSAWEPTVVTEGDHWYSWRSTTYVDACLYVREGGASDSIWMGADTYVTGAAKGAVGWTYWVSASSTSAMGYRLKVYGWYSSNTYDLYGSWRGTNPG